MLIISALSQITQKHKPVQRYTKTVLHIHVTAVVMLLNKLIYIT